VGKGAGGTQTSWGGQRKRRKTRRQTKKPKGREDFFCGSSEEKTKITVNTGHSEGKGKKNRTVGQDAPPSVEKGLTLNGKWETQTRERKVPSREVVRFRGQKRSQRVMQGKGVISI